jgi:hypothetical protein
MPGGYSLRDGDGIDEEIDDIGCIVRMRLRCHAAENLMLTDDVLQFAGTNWKSLRQQLRQFVAEKEAHPKHKELKAFVVAGAQRRTADLKEVRLLLAGFFTNKPWEVIVGQAIARLAGGMGLEGPDSLSGYLGGKVCENLLGLSRLQALILNGIALQQGQNHSFVRTLFAPRGTVMWERVEELLSTKHPVPPALSPTSDRAVNHPPADASNLCLRVMAERLPAGRCTAMRHPYPVITYP